MKTTIKHHNFDFSFTDEDIANQDDCCYQGEYNPHRVRPFLLHDEGFTICVVFADCLQDALDIAVDENKLDRYLVTESDSADYGGDIYNSEQLAYLGNASEPFDVESLGVLELPIPAKSLCAQFGEEITI